MTHLSALALLMLHLLLVVPIPASNPPVTQPQPVDNFEGSVHCPNISIATWSVHRPAIFPAPTLIPHPAIPQGFCVAASVIFNSARDHVCRCVYDAYLHMVGVWCPVLIGSLSMSCSGVPTARTICGQSTLCMPTAMASVPIIPFHPSRSRRRIMPSFFACSRGTSSQNWRLLWMGTFSIAISISLHFQYTTKLYFIIY